MSIRHLDFMFRPGSIAVIGASNKPGRVGSVIMRNLLGGEFAGPVMPVNPAYKSVCGVLAWPDVASLPLTPDLGIVCTPSEVVPGIITALGEKGTRAAVVLTAGMDRHPEQSGPTLRQRMLDAARPFKLRILGPNCLGFLAPALGINASFAHVGAPKGKVAFISQSGALCTAVLDWARDTGIGFSSFISLGDMDDVDFGDLLDYLGGDPETKSILLYIESVKSARKFMSAARAAARNKPVLAIKAGRFAAGARAAASHTGALAGADDVYDAAIRRAGMLRVFEIDELFDAVETLARARPPSGDRLLVLTNGGGPGVMSADALSAGGGRLAELSPDTMAALDAILPPTWSRSNPADIIGDASPERYAKALEVVLKDKNADAVLVLQVPTAISSSVETAKAVIRVIADSGDPSGGGVLTSWLGMEGARNARRLFANAGIPTYDTPGQAVRAFLHLVSYRRNQELLMETPASIPTEFRPVTQSARLIVEGVLAQERSLLTEPEAKAVLADYGIPVVETHVAHTAADAVRTAAEIGYPVALKILSPDVSHKSDVGGVALDLETPEAVRSAAEAMTGRLARMQPEARVTGFTVQKMSRRPGAIELIAGVTTDPVFGPIVLFGQGGTAVEVIGDRAVALPPLNMSLAADLVSRTRIAKLLRGYRDRPPADMAAIHLTLIQLSQLIIDIPEIVELDINPLFADANGVLALDARIKVACAAAPGPARLAIRPYPQELEENGTLRDGRRFLMRPIRPEDEPQHHAFIARLNPEDILFRFFGLVREFQHTQMARFTQIDYDREMAFIATAPGADGKPETLGVVRSVADPDNHEAEFAIIVDSALKRQGMGRLLLEKMIRYCRARGIQTMVGQVLAGNTSMLGLARSMGFEVSTPAHAGFVEVRLDFMRPG